MSPNDAAAGLSLLDWWPVRIALLVALVATIALIVWRARDWVSRTVLGGVVGVLLLVTVLAGLGAQPGDHPALSPPGRTTATSAPGDPDHASTPGTVVSVAIPATTSHFSARRAEMYLPPAWFARPRPQLAVLLLLHGTPGAPTDWLTSGKAQPTLDAWAAAHQGVTPIVVIPDINGSAAADTECVDSPRGKVETYLTVDVPAFVRAQYGSLPPGQNWAVAGLSEGGSCAFMLALRHPDLFRTFGDYSGLAGPREGDTNAVGNTVATLFGGSQPAFNTHEPSYLLTHQSFPHLAGWFEVGDQDQQPLQAAQQLVPLAQRDGITTRLVVLPGLAHTFAVWSQALVDSLPWIVTEITPSPTR